MKKRYIIALIISLIILGLTYKFWLIFKTATSARFDFYPFCIILVVSYLGGLKLTDYLADFKDIKHQSRIEIVFLTIFFIMLFIPMCHIDNSNYSQKERRRLAEYKPLFQKHQKINYNFGNDFNTWYNDRFNTRKPLVDLFYKLKYIASDTYYETSNGFANKKNGWMTAEKTYPSQEILQKDALDNIIHNVENLKKFCDKNNIKFYILIAPRKETICAKNLYPYIGNFDTYKLTQHAKNYILKETNIPIIYPYDEVQNYQDKTGRAFFKTDHHWTDEGAFTAYPKLINKIKKDFPDINILDEKDFYHIYSNKVHVAFNEGLHNGQTYRALNIHDKRLLNITYKYYNYKNNEITNPIYTELIKKNDIIRCWKYVFFNKENKYNLVLFGDSFTLNLIPTLNASFKNTKLLYTWSFGDHKVFNINNDTYQNEILNEKPDILVICLSDIERLGYVFMNDSTENK